MTDAAAPKHWTMEVLLDFRVPFDIQLSPDGQQVTFSYGTGHKIDKDTPARRTIWLLNTATRHVRRFIGDEVSSSTAARWSPDGTQLAFVSDRANRKESQLYVIPFGGGEAERLTDRRGQVTNPTWLPDGKALVFESSAPDSEKALPSPDPVVEDEALPFNRVWQVDTSHRVVRPITPADLHVYEYCLSPDGQWLALVAAPQATSEAWYYAQLYITEIGSGVTRQLGTIAHQIGNPVFSPDGQQLAFIAGTLSDQGAVAGDIYAIAVAATPDIQAENLTPGLDHSPTWLTWNGSRIIYGARQVNGTRISRLDPVTRQLETLIDCPAAAIGNTGPQRISLAADGQTFATVIGSFTAPIAICRGRLDSGNIETLTDLFAETRHYAAPHVEHLEWLSADGIPVEGWLQFPNDYQPGSAFPLLVMPHGGPSASYVPHFGVGAWAWRHLLADQGIGTFMPNPRGSWGRGEAYQSANVGDLGGGDWLDIVSGIDLLIGRGLVDAERLAIFGWSYGGYLTAWAVTQTRRFKCAIAGAAITNMESNYGVVSIRGWQSVLMGSELYDQPEAHRARSPLTFVRNVSTPTLLLHGENDSDVPREQSLELYTALKALKIETQCVIYPREPHGFQERAHQLDMATRAIAWIRRFLAVQTP